MLITKSKKYPNTLKVSHCGGLTVLDVIDLKPKPKQKHFSVFIGENKSLVCRLVDYVIARNIDEAYRESKFMHKLKINQFIAVQRIE